MVKWGKNAESTHPLSDSVSRAVRGGTSGLFLLLSAFGYNSYYTISLSLTKPIFGQYLDSCKFVKIIIFQETTDLNKKDLKIRYLIDYFLTKR